MFTSATRNFGVWKSGHPSRRRFSGTPTYGFILALSMCAFVGWLTFFLCLKTRGDLFLLESLQLNLIKVDEKSKALIPPRQVALGLGVRKTKSGALAVIFDTGDTFVLPEQKSNFSQALKKRLDGIELVGLLSLSTDESISRVQIWPDQNLGHAELSEFLRILTEFGFDDFDIAMETAH